MEPTEGRDTLTVLFSMNRIAQPLEAVRISAREDAARKSYYIDNEEIANSDRPLFTSVDIIEKLRPDMVWGRAGPGGPCGKISSVFVNGRRILQSPTAGTMAASRRALAPGDARRRTSAGRTMVLDKYKVTGMPAEILSVIRPEHIAEMTYNDCFEKSVRVNRGDNAAFVILKPGVGYDNEEGSYVIDGPAPRRRAERGAPAESTGVFPSWRVRILGVFDNESGESIEGAEVVDVVTGTTALTTKTGTVSLAFLPEGGSEVLVKKAGYKPLMIEVLISPRDTVPITLTMVKNK